jgi:hypothetical protein
MACEDRTRMVLQNIHNHVPGHKLSQPKMHNESSPLLAPEILYHRILRTEMSYGENRIAEKHFVSYTLFNNTLFSGNCVLLSHNFSLSKKKHI